MRSLPVQDQPPGCLTTSLQPIHCNAVLAGSRDLLKDLGACQQDLVLTISTDTRPRRYDLLATLRIVCHQAAAKVGNRTNLETELRTPLCQLGPQFLDFDA
jgi:hypothetical protein